MPRDLSNNGGISAMAFLRNSGKDLPTRVPASECDDESSRQRHIQRALKVLATGRIEPESKSRLRAGSLPPGSATALLRGSTAQKGAAPAPLAGMPKPWLEPIAAPQPALGEDRAAQIRGVLAARDAPAAREAPKAQRAAPPTPATSVQALLSQLGQLDGNRKPDKLGGYSQQQQGWLTSKDFPSVLSPSKKTLSNVASCPELSTSTMRGTGTGSFSAASMGGTFRGGRSSHGLGLAGAASFGDAPRRSSANFGSVGALVAGGLSSVLADARR